MCLFWKTHSLSAALYTGLSGHTNLLTKPLGDPAIQMLLFLLLPIAAPTVLRVEPVPGNASQPPRATAPEPVASERLSDQVYNEDLLDRAGDASEQLEECLSYKDYCEDLLDRADAREKSFSDALDETVVDLRACKDNHENLLYWITSPELDRHKKYEALVEKYSELLEENDFLFDLWWNSEKSECVRVNLLCPCAHPTLHRKRRPPAIETRAAVAELEKKLRLARERDVADTRASRESVDALRKMARRAEDKVGIGFPPWERIRMSYA